MRRIFKSFIFSISFFLICISPLFAQINFNDYISLKSEGEIPTDFSKKTYQKINEELITSEKDKKFLLNIHYSIDDILSSGLVNYGDPISKYCSSIADELLKTNVDLRSKLRLYTIQSNSVNAFSTDQGIIFVTTGLISR